MEGQQYLINNLTDACNDAAGGSFGRDWFYFNWEHDLPEAATLHINQGGHTLWKTGKTGKMMNKNSLQGKIREFENFMKIREKSGNFENPVLIRCNL